MAKNKETENPTDDKVMLDSIPGADKKTAEEKDREHAKHMAKVKEEQRKKIELEKYTIEQMCDLFDTLNLNMRLKSNKKGLIRKKHIVKTFEEDPLISVHVEKIKAFSAILFDKRVAEAFILHPTDSKAIRPY